MLTFVAAGLASGYSLIIAIGSQNAFVLQQGLRRSHVAVVVAVCAVSELLLISAGVAGIGALVERAPWAVTLVRWFGVVFLTAYGLFAVRRAIVGGHLEVGHGRSLSRTQAAATALAFTWLNPHVYLDTVLLLGSLASAHGAAGRWWFGAGAGIAGVTWFLALGFGARMLTPMFRRPTAWRVLDAGIAVVMFALAISLV